MPELIEDERFKTNVDRIGNRYILNDIIQEWHSTKTEADVDKLVADGLVEREMADMMKASLKRRRAGGAPSAVDVDRLEREGLISADLAAMMKSAL